MLLVLVWAAPASLLGLLLATAAMATGGRVRRRGRVLEIYGGWAGRFLEACPGGPMAMTLGHTVIGRTTAALDLTRRHEFVHVRQYERWGPLFIPAYLVCSLWQWLAGRDPYRDNPFEVEAFREAP
ncbi:MAG TPA: hypothetical protein VFI31_12955 [Pirellulales bacterium]|nr:hypothetical protein [Pirellulales bacterium]